MRKLALIRSEVSTIAGIGVLIQVLTVVSGPLVARMLGPDGRGVQFLVMLMATIGAQLGSSALAVAISHSVARAHASARDVLGKNLTLWMLWSAIPAILAGVTAEIMLERVPWKSVLVVETFLVTLFACWLNLLGGMLQGEGAIRRINFQRIVFSSIYVGSILAIFVLHPSDLAAVILLPYIAAQLMGLHLSRQGLRKPTGDPVLRVERTAIHRFARRTFVSSIGVLDVLGLDALIVGALLPKSDLGLYAVAISVTTLPAVALAGIAAALLPKMSARPAAGASVVMRRWLGGALLVDLALVLALEVVVSPAIRIFFGDAFTGAIVCAQILIVARALMAMRMVLAAAVQAQGRGGSTSVVELVSAGVLVVATTLGAQHAGIEGAALAVLLTAAFSCACLSCLISWRARGPSTGNGREPETDTANAESTP